MSVPNGTRLGPYEIVAPLGVGGMGEVYRATDSRLKRQVAITILPAALATDPDRLARFQREAEVLASLNHPHIAAVYGLEDAALSTGSWQAGLKALVMELVEGATLAERIAQGSIPVDEALPIARQIAAALEAAHEQGIVHRDLKPANIKAREDGTVKVLDFGLAKLSDVGVSASGSQVDLTNSPTLTVAARTGVGVILGTAAYVSPEQARGRPVDKRTDVWAFGAVLYEMLTGVRAFDGEDVTEMMASVVKSTPNWAAIPADVPSHVVTLIQRCNREGQECAHQRHRRRAVSPVGSRNSQHVNCRNDKDWGCVRVTMAPADVLGAANGCRWHVGRGARRRVGELDVLQSSTAGAAVSSLAPFRTDPPRLMFQAKGGEYDTTAPERSWDVSADGKRFLLVKTGPLTDKPVTTIHVVLNWAQELERLVQAK